MNYLDKKLLLFASIILNVLYSNYSNSNLEIPQIITKKQEIIEHKYYTLSYNEKHEQANWVAYQLTYEQINGTIDRRYNEKWKQDPNITTGTSKVSDYKKSGYDRGHLVPAADMKLNKTSMRETFYMSNITPQHKYCNRYSWKHLEQNLRDLIIEHNDILYIATGPVLNDRLDNYIGYFVTVPNYFYKVILDYSKNKPKAIGFIIPNIDTKDNNYKNLNRFACSIDYIESITGIDFFFNLPDDVELIIEEKYNIKDWGFNF